MDDLNVTQPTIQTTPEAAPQTTTPSESPSLRDTLESVVKVAEKETEFPSSKRDDQGRFTKRNADGSEVPTEEQVKAAQPDLDKALSLDPDAEDEATQKQREEPLPNVDNAPKSWKAVAKEKWASADPVIRAEVHRRERDMARTVQEHAPVKQFAQQFTQAIQPFAQHYSQSGLSPLQLMNNLMQADVHLSTAPAPSRAQFMAKLIVDYGIDINMLAAALAGNDPAENPAAQVEQMINERLAPVNEFLNQQQQSRQQTIHAERQRAETVLNRMAGDTTNFPHFDLVAQDMADITEMALKRRVYLTPQEAYTRAVAMNPEAQAAEQSRAGQQRAHAAHDAATRSLGASLSINGSPAGLKQTVAPDDLRSTIEAAWQEAQGR